MPRRAVKDLLDLAHAHGVVVSTGGFIEHVLTQGPVAVVAYLRECRELGFDIVELSSGFITLPIEDWETWHPRLLARVAASFDRVARIDTLVAL